MQLRPWYCQARYPIRREIYTSAGWLSEDRKPIPEFVSVTARFLTSAPEVIQH
ncbi:MAG: hypothetical protein ACLFVQ_09110 [Chitinispirillaceae bacterium]